MQSYAVVVVCVKVLCCIPFTKSQMANSYRIMIDVVMIINSAVVPMLSVDVLLISLLNWSKSFGLTVWMNIGDSVEISVVLRIFICLIFGKNDIFYCGKKRCGFVVS